LAQCHEEIILELSFFKKKKKKKGSWNFHEHQIRNQGVIDANCYRV
jgi:hypothetical protein